MLRKFNQPRKRYTVFTSMLTAIYNTNSLWKARNLISRTDEHTRREFGERCDLYIWDNNLGLEEDLS